MKPGMEGGYSVRCVNPNCSAMVTLVNAQCPPGWRELEEGYACPREIVRLVWSPASPDDVIELALAEQTRRERQVEGETRRLQHEESMREAAYALEIKRAERQQKLTEQHAREQKNNVYVTKRAQENMDVREAAFIVAASLAGIRSKKATTDRIEDLYGSLSTDMKEKILRAVMGGDVG